jgi:hypothetical protein
MNTIENKKLNDATFPELAAEADNGRRGQGAVVEVIGRLKLAIENLDDSTTRLSRWLVFYTIVLVILTAVLVTFGWYQIKGLKTQIADSEKATSEQLTEDFNRDISNGTNTAIISAIDESRPIRKEKGGNFTDFQLDNYLGVYEIMDGAYANKIISKDDFCAQFEFYISGANQNQEVNNYINEQRKIYKQPGIFGGFKDLATRAEQDCK